jgi:hypothetical protein
MLIEGVVIACTRDSCTIEDEKGEKYNCTPPSFFPVRVGDIISASGDYVNKYYRIKDYSIILNKKEESVIEWLFSWLKYKKVSMKLCRELCKGVKILYPSKDISDIFDSLAWDNYINNPLDRELLKIVNKDQLSFIFNKWLMERVQRPLWILGFNNNMIFSFNKPWHEILNRCLTNPFAVGEISIDKAVFIAKKYDLPQEEKELQLGAALRFVKNKMDSLGWTYIPKDILVKHFPAIKKYWSYIKDYDLGEEEDRIYMSKQLQAENYIIDFIKEIQDVNSEEKVSVSSHLSQDQKDAIQGALNCPWSFILGPAGSGKTTVIKEIVKYLQDKKLKYCLMAYTGKAAMRINEVTGQPASTIHMYLKKLICCDYIIVDEVSMVTTSLMYDLLYSYNMAFKKTPKIICLGDDNQLLPIEAGFFLKEIIKSKSLPIFYLTSNHRCTFEEDGISLNARAICSNTFSKIVKAKNFIPCGTSDKDLNKLLNKFKDMELTCKDFAILSPYKELDGVNACAQNIFTEKGIQDVKGRWWNEGDPVVCRKNLYNSDLFNGEQGIITKVDDLRQEMEVTFKRSKHTFKLGREEKKELKEDKDLTTNNLEVAYAMTVHRSQGSEWDYIIFYLPPKAVAAKQFINRNLIYTAITRARKGVFIIGSLDVFNKGGSLDPLIRNDYLGHKLFALIHPEEKMEEKPQVCDDIDFFDPDEYY